MDDLRTGDIISTPAGLEEIIGFTHSDPSTVTSHVTLVTATHGISLTTDHFLNVNGVLAPASTVQVGVRPANGSNLSPFQPIKCELCHTVLGAAGLSQRRRACDFCPPLSEAWTVCTGHLVRLALRVWGLHLGACRRRPADADELRRNSCHVVELQTR
jgi:hypothetical protein